MEYKGKLYGKVGRRQIPLTLTSEDVDRIEIQLLEAKEVIEMILRAAATSRCADFHHAKKDQHGWHESCPVEKRWREAIKRAEDFIKG